MGRGIKINCKRVYETGLKYNKEAELVKAEQQKLAEVSNSIGTIWTGGDSNNFQVSFNEHIKSLDEVIVFLENKAMILKGNALDHSTIDNDFTNKMKRSDMNEQY
jgi:exonuclease VII small subunit